jgi:cell division protein FtsZ
MLFIVSGFGGGTGTGAVPVIARAAHERGILTVAVVTTPFTFEAVNRTEVAQTGLQELRKSVDTFVVIANQKLFDVQTEGMSLLDSFQLVDNVLHDGVRGITDLLMCPGLINLDFADVRSAMKDAGAALMGTGEATGDNRIEEATNAAISNPLLSYQGLEMDQATSLLVNITSSANVSLAQTERIMEIIRGRTHERVNLKVGVAIDDDMGDTIRVSVVMAGLDREHGSGLDAAPPRTPGHSSKSPKASRSEPLPGQEAPGRQGHLEVPGVFGRPTLHREGVDSRQTPSGAVGAVADMSGLDPTGSPLRSDAEPAAPPAANAESMGRPTPNRVDETTLAAATPPVVRQVDAVAGDRPQMPRPEPQAAGRGNGAGHAAVEAARAAVEQPTSADRRVADGGHAHMPDGSRTEAGHHVLRAADREAPVQDSRPRGATSGSSARGTSGPDPDPAGYRAGLDGTGASGPVAGAAVARGAVTPRHLRPAVHFGSEASGGATSWTKLFGFLSARRKAGNDRREPSLQSQAPAATAKETGNARPSASGLIAGRDQGVDSGPAWAGGETARAVLGIDPRQIPSFRK